MDTTQLQAIETWFETYVQGFYDGRGRHDAHIRLKQLHSAKVCDEMAALCDSLGLGANDRRIAHVVALLHDAGRFEQYRRYQTFMDARSENHSLLGLRILDEHGVLDGLDAVERDLIVTAIRHHGDRELPADLPDRDALFCRLIRDADKIDIFRIVLDNYRRWKQSPEGFVLDIPFPDDDSYSPALVEAVLQGRSVDYSQLRTIHDVRLLQLGWIHDINFPEALRRIRDRGYLDELLGGLPDDECCRRLRDYVGRYVAERLAGESP